MNEKMVVAVKKYYPSIDGLRALSCIGIMMMHIKANTHYQLTGFIWNDVIWSFTHLVILFIMISGFGMCVGYLDRFLNGTVDLEKFYKRRYQKILPYFVFLIIIALIYEPTVTNFYDATMEFLLVYGFLPNNALNIIGVGWTIGTIFVFYFLFPAFSVLMKSKRRAWIFLFVSLWINFVCSRHYFANPFVQEIGERHYFIWCMPLFMGGGIMYLCRKVISDFCKKFRCLLLAFCGTCTVLYYIIPQQIGDFNIIFYKNFILYSLWLIYAIGVDSKVLGNRVMKFISAISLEIYLSHMVVFRFMEKIHVEYLFGDDRWISYIVLCLLTFAGVLMLVFGYKLAVKILNKYVICKILKQKEVTNEQ